MHPDKLLRLLENVRNRKISTARALESLKKLPFENLGFARLDHHRHLRKGFPEVIFAPGKSNLQILKLAQAQYKSGSDVFVTRVEEPVYKTLKNKFPKARYNSLARTVVIERGGSKPKTGCVLVISAGTADLPVAEEAVVTCQVMGSRVERLYDVGVAGIHRVLADWNKLRQARVLIVVAGMEGALASVVAGMVDKPVIAVPTSVGYGASFGGIAALLSMLNSCANGVTVVNIDNGFGAGVSASLINRK